MGKNKNEISLPEQRAFFSTEIVRLKFILQDVHENLAHLRLKKDSLKRSQELLDKADIKNPTFEEANRFVLTRLKQEELKLVEIQKSVGHFFFLCSPHLDALFTIDDIRTLFNVSYIDMLYLLKEKKECGGGLVDLLLHSWWVSDTAFHFGKAFHLYCMSIPQYKEQLKTGLLELLQETGVPSYSPVFNGKGEMVYLKQNPPKLRLVK